MAKLSLMYCDPAASHSAPDLTPFFPIIATPPSLSSFFSLIFTQADPIDMPRPLVVCLISQIRANPTRAACSDRRPHMRNVLVVVETVSFPGCKSSHSQNVAVFNRRRFEPHISITITCERYDAMFMFSIT